MNQVEDNYKKIKLLIKEGQLSEALALTESTAAMDPLKAQSLYLKSVVLYLSGERAKSEECIIQAIAIDSVSPDYYVLLGNLYQHKRRSEEAVYLADRALQVKASYRPALQLKAIALIQLLRLQEAHSVIQALQKLPQQQILEDDTSGSDLVLQEDPETIFEQALTIDPFKTKSRIESLDTMKAQTRLFGFFYKLGNSGTSATLRGLAIFIGLITSVSFFFRDNAQYKSFSLLIFSILISVMIKTHGLSITTNLPPFFSPPFRKFLQRRDIVFSIKALLVFIIFIGSFFAWHYSKSVTGLVIAIISVSYFSILHEESPNGHSLKSFTVPRPKAKASERKDTMVKVKLQDVPYDNLFLVVRRPMPWLNRIGGISRPVILYGVLFVILYPALFAVLKWTGLVSGYSLLLIPEVAVLFGVQLFFAISFILNIPVFYKAEARKFIPAYARRRAYLVSFFEMLLIASLSLWLVVDNAHVLWGSGVLFLLIVRSAFQKSKEEPSPLLKEELIAYIQRNYQASKVSEEVEATPPQTPPDEANSK